MNSQIDALLSVLATTQGRNENQQNLYDRLRKAKTSLPPAILEDVVLKLNDLLPKARKQYGEGHATYLFYIDLLMICLWAQRWMGISEDSQRLVSNLRLEITVLREQLNAANHELEKYSTAQEIILSGTIDMYMRKVLDNLTPHMPDHPRVKAFAAALDLLEPTN